MRRVVWASVVGTALEAYDLYLYGTAAALVFGPLFFPNGNPAVGTLLALSTFALSFIARPIGALFFGHFGDRVGRKRVLWLTLLLMGGSTFLIGCLPTYAAIGFTAPLILVVLRFVQGFGFGGEYSGAVLMLMEHAPENRRGFYAGLNNVGPVFGFIASSGLFIGLTDWLGTDQFVAWGWRIPFLFSIVLIIVGLIARSRLTESPLFMEAVKRHEVRRERIPVVELFRTQWRQVVLTVGANIAQFASNYLVLTFALSYGVSIGVNYDTVLLTVIIAVCANIIVIPIASQLSDRVGRKPVIIVGLIGTAVWAFPFFALFNTAQLGFMILGFVPMMVFYSTMFGPIASFSSEQFSTTVRYTGSALSYNLAGILGAAFAPLIASALLTSFNSSVPISIYLIGLCVISLICVLIARETNNRRLAAS
ncbi:MFS transporter [Compostimonas suwonensis]|nr:MFS transporter [Compostimonas suwonensis]